MQWTDDHDEILCREILTVDPFADTKKGTVQRGQKWKDIASKLSAIETPRFKVDARAVRERYQLLSSKLRKKLKDEKKASGIETDMSDVEKALEDLLEKEDASNEAQEESDSKKKKKADDVENAEKMRKKAMERMGTKRQSVEGGEQAVKKRRSSGNDTIQYLRERNEQNMEARKEELDFRQQELSFQAKRHNDMMQLMMQQQQQQMQKDQEFKVLMMTMLNKLTSQK